MPLNLVDLIQASAKRISPYLEVTPLELSKAFSQKTGREVFFKCENKQITRSFKFRGALSRISILTDAEKKKGVVAASTGNHGLGVAEAAKLFAVDATIFVPETAAQSKVTKLMKTGMNIVVFGATCEAAEKRAREFAAKEGKTYLSPYNDWEVVAGQGTCGLELTHQLFKTPDRVFISVGGGGLIAGVAAILKSKWPKIKVIGVSPENDCAMKASLDTGKIIEIKALPTLSDGTAGGVEEGSITFSLCQNLVDEFVLVTEEEILNSYKEYSQTHSAPIEGAAACAIAGCLKFNQLHPEHGTDVVVLCGGNQ